MAGKEKILAFRITAKGISEESKEIAKLETEMSKLAVTRAKLIKQSKTDKELTAKQKTDLATVSQNTRDLNSRKKELLKTENNLSREFTTQKGSMARLRAETSKLVRTANNLNLETKEGRAELKRMGVQIDANKQKIRNFDRQMSGSKTLVGEYGKGFKEAFAKISMAIIGVIAALRTMRGVWNLVAKDFADFETGQLNIQSLLDEFDDTLKDKSIGLIRKYGLEIQDLNKSMFDAISAGSKAAEITEFMSESAILAIAGVTDLTTATNAIAKVINIYGLEMSEAGNIADAYFSAQKKGVTTVALLADNLGKAATVAAGVDIAYQELLATFATLSKVMDSTEETSTVIRNVINALISPSEKAAAAFKKAEIETGVLALRQNGLFETLKKVASVTEENADLITEFIPNIRALTGALALNKEKLAELDEVYKLIKEDIGDTSSKMLAFYAHMESVNKKLDIAKAKLKLTRIEIGGNLAPAFLGLIETINFLGESLVKTEGRFKGMFAGRIFELLLIKKAINDATDSLEEMNEEIEVTSEVGAAIAKITKYLEALTEAAEKRRADAIKVAEKKQKELNKIYDDVATYQLETYQRDLDAFIQFEQDKIEAKREALKKSQSMTFEEEEEAYDRELELLMMRVQEGIDYRKFKLDEELQNKLITQAQYDEQLLILEKATVKAKVLFQEQGWKLILQYASFALSQINMMVNAAAINQQAQMNAELKAAGDNESKKDAIRKEYAKKAQKTQVKQAIIGTAMAVVNALATVSPFWAALVMAGVAAIAGGIQVANIKAQKFAEGGRVPTGHELPGYSKTSDNTLALVKPNEVILNPAQQVRLGGAQTFKAIGVPGFAEGGLVGGSVMQSGGSLIDIEMLGGIIAEQMNAIQVVQNINELNDAQNELDVIQTREPI